MPRKFVFLAAALPVLLFAGLSLKPADRGGPYDTYFKNLNTELRSGVPGLPRVVLDLDRVDANLSLMQEHMRGADLNYRIVVKSLPALDLIRYIMQKTGTRRLMVFHAPFLATILRQIKGDLDILPGKPIAAPVARELIERPGLNAARRVQWLVDTPERLRAYMALGKEIDRRLRINIEIDVGLRRGGAVHPDEFVEMLELIAHSEHLEFTGVMGYDGHVPHVPVLLGGKEAAVRASFAETMTTYASFIEAGRNRFPQLFQGELTLNSGGSKTYALFSKDDSPNEVAVGSAVLKPMAFNDFTLGKHRPALFIAAPVVKYFSKFHMPFEHSIPGVSSVLQFWEPHFARSFYLYGGGWPGRIVAPPGIQSNPFTAGPPNENLLPNQSLYHASAATPIEVGDFVFTRPMQGDALFQFEEILLLRAGRLTGSWKTFPRKL